MDAYETALSEGCPDSLFRGLCDWIEKPEHIVDSDHVGYRYSLNTRAYALNYWRNLNYIYGKNHKQK